MTENEELRNMKRQLQTIYKVNSFLLSITNKKELLKQIMNESEKIVNAEASSLMLYNEKENCLYFEVVLGDESENIKKVTLNMGDGIAGTAALNREVINVEDVEKDDRYFKDIEKKSDFKTRSLLAVPLLKKDKLIGVIEVLNKKGMKKFSDEDVKIMRILAKQAAIALENARLVEENIRSEKLAAIGETISGTAHYIKNILAGLKGGVYTMELAIKKSDWDILKKSWEIHKRSSTKIEKLVNNMLTYSKDRVLIKSQENIADIINEITELVRDRAKTSNVAIEAKHESLNTEIHIDSGAIADALLNLIVNAMDANDKTEGKILIETKKSKNDEMQITISDNGKGIQEDIIEKIFEPFFSTKGSKGTGLGLAVAKKIIMEHNGRIEVKSSINEGTEFMINLPIMTPEI